ncbi:kinase-like domain-containing protein, partial [Phaeosphaeriaceae sp. PMI808]
FNPERKQYHEIKWTRGQEPRKRSLRFIASSAQSQWHVTVTFEGSLHPDRIARADAETRYQDLRDLCLCLDFNRLRLFDDTVTEILIKREYDNTPPASESDMISPKGILPLNSTPPLGSEYHAVLHQLRHCVREDPNRVHFPVFDCNSYTKTIEFSELTRIRKLSAGVYEVRVCEDDGRYVCKEVDNSNYLLKDSQVPNQELRNLKTFLGTEGIVQLVAAVISRNPYQTSSKAREAHDACDSDQSNQSKETNQSYQNTRTPVLRGILLEYYPTGTLADALQSTQETPQLAGTWRRWALQMAEALARVHEKKVTHMDLKPSNVLISAEINAVLSDVSGIGGVTRDYLAPEMLDIQDPLAETLQSRVYNDIWALGKMFREMGDASSDDTEKQQLKTIGRNATSGDPTLRPSLRDISSLLST